MDSFTLKKKQIKETENKREKPKDAAASSSDETKKSAPAKIKKEEKLLKRKEKSRTSTNANDSPYDSDSSDEELLVRTGNIPQKWYNEFDHKGYSIDSKKVIKPAEQDELEKFLTKAKNRDWWRNITDDLNNKTVYLSDKDLEMIKRIRKGVYANESIKDDEYFEDNIPYQVFPLSNHRISKKKFLPSSYEQKMINRFARMIEQGLIKIKPDKAVEEELLNDIWTFENSNPGIYHPAQGFAMPKAEAPDNDLSYNPVPGLVDREAILCLRKIPKYDKLLNDQYDRCLDIFQSARVIKKKQDIKEEDILPQLPKPEELKPFPSKDNIVFKGHDNHIRCITVDDSGNYLISGDTAGFVHFYDILTTKMVHKSHVNDKILKIEFNKVLKITVVCCESSIYFIRPVLFERRITSDVVHSQIIPKIEEKIKEAEADQSKNIYEWKTYEKSSIRKNGILFSINWKEGALSDFVWHVKGDFFATLSKNQLSQTQIYIHNLSTLDFYSPLSKNKGLVTCISFHPLKPHFYVCTHSNIMIYDLKQQELIRKFVSNLKTIKCISIHPSGADFIVGSLEGQVAWFQADLSEKPYKIMEYHQSKVKSVAFHSNYPLFASATKGGEILVYHSKVFEDFIHDPLIVPLQKLSSIHKKTESYEVNDAVFHPKNPWLFTCGSDKVIRLWS